MINNLLIGVCSLFKSMGEEQDLKRSVTDLDIDYTKEAKDKITHKVDTRAFTEQNAEKCIYETEGGSLTVIEYAPAIFRRLR